MLPADTFTFSDYLQTSQLCRLLWGLDILLCQVRSLLECMQISSCAVGLYLTNWRIKERNTSY